VQRLGNSAANSTGRSGYQRPFSRQVEHSIPPKADDS
jgi:hypothetical protein